MNLDIDFATHIKPGNDFFGYVNQNWINNNPIPEDHTRWGSFIVLDEINKKRIKEIMEQKFSENSEYFKFSTLYEQGLKENERKDTEIYYYLDQINSSNSITELLNLVVDYETSWNIGSPFHFSIYSDFDDANLNILHLFTGGLGLPDRDYYFLENKSKEREEYKNFLITLFKHMNLDFDVDAIYKLEEQLAEKTYTRVQKRDPELLKNPTSLQNILQDYSNFGFIKFFFDKINVQPGKINLVNKVFFKNLDRLFTEVSLETWKQYFCLRFIQTCNTYLSTDIEKLFFDFYGKTLSGTKQMKPLWKRVLMNTEDQLGQLIGRCYVEKYFSSNAKSQALEMIQYLKDELKNRIIKLEWMQEETKTKALLKLDKMKVKVGYPDKWRQYTSDIRKDYSYFKNNIMCNQADNLYRIEKLYKAIDRDEWFMDPQAVNAYYSPSYNEIVFPAGILQPPFFSEQFDKAINFGGIGAVIGHEMTHGFDDQGCRYDSDGNLNNWWTNEDKTKYESRINILKDQFDEYVIEGEKVNGKLTLGENIADLGGVLISIEGFKKYLSENPSENKLIDGLTPLERFFVSYAIIWRNNVRPEETKQRLLLDPHSPPSLRVNGILRNINDFYNIFRVNLGDDLYLDESMRACIW